jgi:hypothetical protein
MDTENRAEPRRDAVVIRSFFGHRCRIAPAMVATVAALLSGCDGSGGHPPVCPLEGKVLFKGTPISGGIVVFELEGGEPASSNKEQSSGPFRATGRIHEDGRFRLQAFPGTEGVPAGNYKVGISSMPPRTEASIFDGGAVKKGNPDVLHGRYADPKTSGLKAQVVKGQPNEQTFDLK